METKAFDNGYVGYRVNTIKEVINAQTAGLKICNEDGYYFNNYIEVVNPETGNEEERAPTDDEIFQNIQKAMENERQLYATFYLDCGDVVPRKLTTLQSDFHVGQEVFYMKDNKIQNKCIFRILLIETAHYNSYGENIKIVGDHNSIQISSKECNIYILAERKFYKSISNTTCIKYDFFEVVKETDIFATKEELVKHLLEA